MQIFLAKKEEDQIRARRIRDILKPYLGQNNSIVMAQDIPKGTKYRDWIKGQLKESELLLLLFSGPSRDWSWCLWEIGLITPLTERPVPPIVCILPPDETPPDPIDDLQAVHCTVDSLAGFLESFFDGSLFGGDAINSAVADDEELLHGLATNICEEWIPRGGSENRLYYTRHITITMQSVDDASPVLTDAAVIDGDRLSLEIFNVVEKPSSRPWTWGSFKSYLEQTAAAAGEDATAFVSRFAATINSACRDEMISPSEHCIESLSSGKRYQPVIHRRDSYLDGTYRIRVLFVQKSEVDAGPRNLTFPAPPGE